jgi:hypothetical protein
MAAYPPVRNDKRELQTGRLSDMRKSKRDDAFKDYGQGMRFRRGCFFITAMLLALLTCLVFVFPTTFYQNDSDELDLWFVDPPPEEVALIFVVFTTPVSIPVLLLMGWRNDVGLKKQRRHLEELAALRREQGDEHLDH